MNVFEFLLVFAVGACAGAGALYWAGIERHDAKEKKPSEVMEVRLNEEEMRAKEDRARRKAEEERQFDKLMQYKGVKQ